MITTASFRINSQLGVQEISLPQGSKILQVAVQPYSGPHVWAQVDTDCPNEDREIFIIRDGEKLLYPSLRYISSFFEAEPESVNHTAYHVYAWPHDALFPLSSK
jgi:hypothetical protein